MTSRTRSLMAALVLAMAAPTLTAAAPVHAHSNAFVTIPPGTTLNVRLAETIHVNFARPGETYHAVLNRPVSMHRMVVIPRGSTVLLKAVGVNRSGGSDRVLLRASSVSFGGRTYRIKTSSIQATGRREGRGPVKRAALGAAAGTAVGGMAGGGSGAGTGAVVGGTTGVLAGSRKSERVRISANTRFQFRLNSAVHVRH
jgi:hypothetical protein